MTEFLLSEQVSCLVKAELEIPGKDSVRKWVWSNQRKASVSV